MEIRSTIPALLLALFGMVSCSGTQEFEFALQESFTIKDTVNLTNGAQRDVDPALTWSKFSSITGSLTALDVVEGATYVVVRDSGDTGQFGRITLGVGSVDGNPPITIVWSDTSLPLLNAVGVTQTILFTDSSKAAIARLFRTNPYKARWYVAVTTNKRPTYFEIVFRIPFHGSYSSSWL